MDVSAFSGCLFCYYSSNIPVLNSIVCNYLVANLNNAPKSIIIHAERKIDNTSCFNARIANSSSENINKSWIRSVRVWERERERERGRERERERARYRERGERKKERTKEIKKERIKERKNERKKGTDRLRQRIAKSISENINKSLIRDVKECVWESLFVFILSY